MEVTPKSRLQVRVQNIIFVILFLTAIALLAWLSQRYSFEVDTTASGRNTLSEATVTLLQRMPGPIEITAFARDSNLVHTRRNIADMLDRYQRHKADIIIDYVNPDTAPDLTRELGIQVDGELVVRYNQRSEHVQHLSEENLTNVLQRLWRGGERQVVFIAGHGERNPQSHANHDYGQFVRHLESKGIRTSRLRLAEQGAIAEDTAVLVIASPQTGYLAGEVALIQNYLRRGGNLLWLHEPGPLHGLEALAGELGIEFVAGTIVDPTTQLLGINDPSFALITQYGDHPIVRNFAFMTIFPRATGISYQIAAEQFTHTPILQTAEHSWAETGRIEGRIEFDPQTDSPGPLIIGLALERARPRLAETDADADTDAQQRIVVLGDGDFLSNTYLGNQGNQNLGYNIINWLSHDDEFIAIPARTAPDTDLRLDTLTWSLLGLLFLFGVPLLLLGYGVLIWWRRRKF